MRTRAQCHVRAPAPPRMAIGFARTARTPCLAAAARGGLACKHDKAMSMRILMIVRTGPLECHRKKESTNDTEGTILRMMMTTMIALDSRKIQDGR